ncbi:MAG: AraC family transcriptional regulator [Candidatus Izemoplasmatales bacterium]|nr:AraC family transcriptional regulator [Candidatus Izemoplasmatales bacterium]
MTDERAQAVKRMQIYIREHIHQPMSISDLAHVAHYSPWYSMRLFKEYTGKTAYEYIRLFRLTLAAKRLRDSGDKVIDVALDFVFDSHEGFTRAFSSVFNITPKAYQIAPIPLSYFKPYEILTQNKISGGNTMETKAIFVQIMERPKRKVIIRRAMEATEYFKYCEEVGCDVWGLLSSVKEALHEPMGMWLSPILQKAGTSMYVQGVEVPIDYQGVVPDGCDMIELPETHVMIFQGEPYDDENFREEVGFVMERITQFNPTVYGYQYDTNGYRFQFAPEGYRGYIEGRTVIKIKK